MCRRKRCKRPGHAHQHLTEDCGEHAFCTIDQPLESMPFYMTLPRPLPVPNIADESLAEKNPYPYLGGLKDGKCGETGPLKPDMKAIVTQESLDHYMAQ